VTKQVFLTDCFDAFCFFVMYQRVCDDSKRKQSCNVGVVINGGPDNQKKNSLDYNKTTPTIAACQQPGSSSNTTSNIK
jgi:hypothetical protein